jgi:hypothetical protein
VEQKYVLGSQIPFLSITLGVDHDILIVSKPPATKVGAMPVTRS